MKLSDQLPPPPSTLWVLWAERGVLVLGVLVALFAHLGRYADAGPLWRDEVGTVNVSRQPTLALLWENLRFDSFPSLYSLTLRFLPLESTESYRLLGLTTGLMILAAVCWGSVRPGRVPLMSLALVGCGSQMILWGDTVRAYGFAVISICLLVSSAGRYVRKPTGRKLAWVFLWGLVAVHLVYFDSVLFAAVVLGAAVALRREPRRVLALFVIAGLVAASLLIYIPTIRVVGRYDLLQKIDLFSPGRFFAKLTEAISPYPPVGIVVLLIGVGLVFVAATKLSWRGSDRPEDLERRRVVRFAAVAIVLMIVGYFAFMRVTSYPTSAWHYLPLVAGVALLTDLAFQNCGSSAGARLFWALAAGAVIGASATEQARGGFRMTNLQDVAGFLEKSASPGDAIIVYPFEYGIPLRRYLGPERPFVTIPEISDLQTHRYDLLIAAMQLPDQTLPPRPAEQVARAALQAGGRVWFVGPRAMSNPGEPAPTIAPAPDPRWGWKESKYCATWSMHFWTMLRDRGATAELVLKPDGGTSPLENVPVYRIDGWKE